MRKKIKIVEIKKIEELKMIEDNLKRVSTLQILEEENVLLLELNDTNIYINTRRKTRNHQNLMTVSCLQDCRRFSNHCQGSFPFEKSTKLGNQSKQGGGRQKIKKVPSFSWKQFKIRGGVFKNQKSPKFQRVSKTEK